MYRLSIFIIIFPAIFFAADSFASDTVKIKRTNFISVSGGISDNTVHGSMVDRNNQFGYNVKMEKRGGYIINVNIEKNLSDIFFVRTGLGFIHKQINPMVNTIAIFKDELRTDYLAIPVELGINLLPTKRSVNLAITIGTLTNLRIADRSIIGPDRVNFKTPFITQSFYTGARINFIATPKNRFFLQYNYIHDLTNSYVETLYWSSAEPNKDFIYKYKTHVVTMGLQWPTK